MFALKKRNHPVQKIILSKKSSCPKNHPVQKIILSKKSSCPKIILSQNHPVQKIILSKKSSCPKIILPKKKLPGFAGSFVGNLM
jgi:hypothetical protein